MHCPEDEASSDEEVEVDDPSAFCGNTGAAIIQDYRLPPSPTPRATPLAVLLRATQHALPQAEQQSPQH
eukprot:6751532-Lingulodinium_polyedra.AAC.1